MTELFPLVEDLWLEVLLSLHLVLCSAAEVPNHRVVDRYQTTDDLVPGRQDKKTIRMLFISPFPFYGSADFYFGIK